MHRRSGRIRDSVSGASPHSKNLASKLGDAGYEAQWDERIEGRKRFYTRATRSGTASSC
jgi:hypothetical protein